jgi:uncharacterized tellurite resistance protein B-like protein
MAATPQADIREQPLDIQRAIASLLVLVAKADRVICAAESAEMLSDLTRSLGTTSAETLELMMRSVNEATDDSQLEAIAACLNAGLSMAEKQGVLLMLLKVIAADGRRRIEEIDMFSETVSALKIPADAVHEVFDEYFCESPRPAA